jgi:hypothetical protein
VHFKLTGPASGDGIDADRPENDGYSRSVALGFLEHLETRGHTFDEVDTDALTLEERKQLYFGRVAEFDLYASRSRRKGERVARVYQGYDPEVGHDSGRLFGREIPSLSVYEVRDGNLIGLYPHDDPDGSLSTIVGFLSSLVAAEELRPA